MLNELNKFLSYERKKHRKLSFIVHVSIAIYLVLMMLMSRTTPDFMVVGFGIFAIIYGLSLVYVGLLNMNYV